MTSVRTALRPRLWIVAGPNGCGKSSAYDRSDVDEFGGSVWIINPDLLTVRIRDHEQLPLRDSNLAAVVRIEQWLDASLDAYQTIGVETVLSTDKYRRLVDKASQRGFETRLIYVYVDTLARQMERIAVRVANGGHAVPEDKVRERRARSFAQLPWFFWHAHSAWIFDNSGDQPVLVGRKDEADVSFSDDLSPDLLGPLTTYRDG